MGQKGDKTRDKIVDAARALFHAKGYTNTSMDDIVRKAGVTKGNLYYYFSSKEALGSAVVERTIADQFGEPPDAHGDPTRHILDMFRTAERGLTDRNCKGGCLFGNLALEVSDLHDHIRQKLEDAFARWQTQLEHLLIAGKRDGIFRTALDPQSMAHCIVATLEGGILLSKVQRDVRALKSCTRMIERVLAGFRA